MKTPTNHIIIACLFYSTTMLAQNFHYINGVEYQSGDDAQEELAKFYEPVVMTSEGINNFFKKMYNHPIYAGFLPNDFSHLKHFLTHGNSTKQTRTYAQSVMRLFGNKLKACSYVNATAFNELLEQLPSLLEPHFTITRTYAFDELKKRINNVLYAQFFDKFVSFKHDPQHFFEDLSLVILDEFHTQSNDIGVISVEELRKTTLVFLEIGLSKLLWKPEDKVDTWKNVKSIAENLALLFENSILIDPDDLNDLFVSLTERYCYFLDIAATDMPLTFYQAVTHDIMSTNPLLLELTEPEDNIEPKAQRLLGSLARAEALCRSSLSAGSR